MSVCFYPTSRLDTSSPRKIERYRFINEIKLIYKIDKSVIDDTIKYILMHNCCSSVVGYNTITNKYWCKIYGKSNCDLHLEIYIKGLCFDSCELQITPLIGETKFISEFIKNIDQGLQMFQTQSIIKSCASFENRDL